MKLTRVNVLLSSLILLCLVVLGNLYYLQIIKGDFYKAQAKGQQNIVDEVKGKRGDIYFKDGINALALTKESPYLFLSPEEIEDEFEYEIAEVLESIVEIDKEKILPKTRVQGSYYQVVKKDLTEEELNKIQALDYKGIYIGKESKRVYPGNDFSAQLSGFINAEEKGQYGIEGFFNDTLSGKSKFIKKIKDLGSFFLRQEDKVNNNGSDIYLTIDYNIQFKAERILDEALKTYEAESGTIIVVDPYEGEILALAESPRFDLNNYNKCEDFSVFQSNATQLLFEPGSIFKPITMA
ncbi:MAG: penicillin-binding transpeptidase domain-containing protein, partial [Candidatus Paceibacterota bacterium]